MSGAIIDCGGGVVERNENMRALRKNSKVFWLKAGEDTIRKRISTAKDRPSLMKGKSFISEIRQVLKRRNPLYHRSSDTWVLTDEKDAGEVAAEISAQFFGCKKVLCITEKTMGAAEKEITKSKAGADLLEIRADLIRGLTEKSVKKLISKKRSEIIFTIRSRKEGGMNSYTEKKRLALINAACEAGADLVDVELSSGKKLISAVSKAKKNASLIVSYHNFSLTPKLEELERTYLEAKKSGADIVKIVTKAKSINDNFTIFKLLEGKSDLAAFCMGLQGQMSRILAKNYGSRLTYASGQGKKEAAPGQLTTAELDEYNFDKITPNTKVISVVGEHAENSKSRHMHNTMFAKQKIDCVYIPLKTRKEELKTLIDNFRSFGFHGAAITIPHKENIISMIDRIDQNAKNIGAVNTIINSNGALLGYNTDAAGAVLAIKEKTAIKGKKALVIGAGGAGRAIVYGLKREGAKVTITNRTKEKADALAKEFGISSSDMSRIKDLIMKNDIVINATSVGMKPKDNETIIPTEALTSASHSKEKKILLDIVYTPLQTRLIRDAKKAGFITVTGERMLIHQAMGQYKIWTGRQANFGVMESAIINQIRP